MTYADRATTIRADVAALASDADTEIAAKTAEIASLTAALAGAKSYVSSADAVIANLERWKAEASTVLSGWEDVYVALGSPGALGSTKSVAALAAVKELQARIAELTKPTPPPVTTRPRRFAPPVLTDPLTFDLTPATRKAIIPGDRDAIVRIPAALRDVAGGIEIIGGRNVRLIGGQITYTGAVQVTRALYLKGVAGATQPRSIHVEGLLIDGGTINGDAIDIDCQGVPTTVTLQNIDVALTLAGSMTGNHSDAVQTWNGPNLLRVDGMVVRNPRYQGFMLDPRKFYPAVSSAGVELHNVHIVQDATEYGYAFYSASAGPLSGSNVRVRGNGTRSGYPSGAWPFVSTYTGTPEADDKFLSGKPGMSYVSPGYAA